MMETSEAAFALSTSFLGPKNASTTSCLSAAFSLAATFLRSIPLISERGFCPGVTLEPQEVGREEVFHQLAVKANGALTGRMRHGDSKSAELFRVQFINRVLCIFADILPFIFQQRFDRGNGSFIRNNCQSATSVADQPGVFVIEKR